MILQLFHLFAFTMNNFVHCQRIIVNVANKINFLDIIDFSFSKLLYSIGLNSG